MIRYIPNQKVNKRKKKIKMLNEKGVELLKQVIQKKYNNISLDNVYVNENEFYYEFKIDEQVSENDFDFLENEIRKLDNGTYVKLLRISGAYYEGNASNEMITRIVGKCFENKEELDKYNQFLNEAKCYY